MDGTGWGGSLQSLPLPLTFATFLYTPPILFTCHRQENHSLQENVDISYVFSSYRLEYLSVTLSFLPQVFHDKRIEGLNFVFTKGHNEESSLNVILFSECNK